MAAEPPLGTPEEVAEAIAEKMDSADLYVGQERKWWPGIYADAEGDRVTLTFGSPSLDRRVVLRVESVTED